MTELEEMTLSNTYHAEDAAKLRANYVEVCAELEAARKVAEAAVAALKQVEWVSTAGCDHAMSECPWCGELEYPSKRHANDCPRQIALGCCKNVADKKEDASETSPVVYPISRWI